MRSVWATLLFPLAWLLFVASCSPVPSAVAPTTAFAPAQSPTPVSTLSPRTTPTIAKTSILTPTATPDSPTAVALPASTPDSSRAYTLLSAWTEHDYAKLIAQVRANIEFLQDHPDSQGVYGQAYYRTLDRVLAQVEGEAVLRFPDSPQAEYWEWDRCYNLAYSSPGFYAEETPTLHCYIGLIKQAYRSGIPVEGLPHWFSAHESRLELRVTQLQGTSSGDPTYSLQLSEGGDASQALMVASLHLNELDVYGLRDGLYYVRGFWEGISLADITGDGLVELIVTDVFDTCCGSAFRLTIYELGQLPPRALPILDRNGLNHSLANLDSGAVTLPEGGGGNGFAFSHNPNDPFSAPCTFETTDRYEWNGEEFELVASSTSLPGPTPYENSSLCSFARQQATTLAEQGVASRVLAYSFDDQKYQEDQLLYRLGEYYARIGNWDRATEFFRRLQASPNSAQSQPYIDAASSFLRAGGASRDYFRICASTEVCDTATALRQLVADQSPGGYPLLIEALEREGVPVAAKGSLELFTASGNTLWATVKDKSSSQYEFWIFPQVEGSLSALLVGRVLRAVPSLTTSDSLPSAGGGQIFTLDKTLSFAVALLPSMREAVLFPVDSADLGLENGVGANFAEEMIQTEWSILLTGGDPGLILGVKDTLGALQPEPCDPGPLCAEPQYLVALGYELAGQSEEAKGKYLSLWKDHPDSLYSVISQFKLSAHR